MLAQKLPLILLLRRRLIIIRIAVLINMSRLVFISSFPTRGRDEGTRKIYLSTMCERRTHGELAPRNLKHPLN